MTNYEQYVSDPAEPAPRRRFARLQPWIVTLAIVVLLTSLTALYMIGRGEEDPALEVPASES